MATRLDRLVALLDTGATPVVRSTAARQIGGIQRQHPEELFRLLARVYEYIGSKSWDTRVAATQAFEWIAKEVSEWDPPETTATSALESGSNPDIKPVVDSDDSDMLTFAQFNVDSVLRHGRILLGSSGGEYDDGLQGLDGQARLELQRAQIKKRLGMGADFMADELLDDADLGGNDEVFVEKKPTISRGRKRKSEAESNNSSSTATEEPAAIDMSKLSARERNRLKRKARMDNKKKSKVELGPKKVTGADTHGKEQLQQQVDVTEQPGGGAIVVEAKKAGQREALFAISEGAWAFEGLVEMLCINLFDSSWEVRHGAGMALREILKRHGKGAGRIAGCSAEENSLRNQRFLEDVSVRLVCVFTLDRFGDFVSDHVVAPVRETCAQTLGAVSQFAGRQLVQATQRALLDLIQRGGGDSDGQAAIWEARHAGLAGLRYVVAVRRDMAAELADATLTAALAGLRDGDDDVRAVSADTLLPLVEPLAAGPASRILAVFDGVWAALAERDDMSASAASVLLLAARLVAQPSVRVALADAGRRDPSQYALPRLIPRLFPFLRHTIAAVRRATLQTLQTFAAMCGGPSENIGTASDTSKTEPDAMSDAWADATCLRLVLQNMVLETDAGILTQSQELWTELLRQGVALTMDAVTVTQMFQLIATPIGTALPSSLLLNAQGDSDCSSARRHNVDAPMIQQDLGLLSRDTIMRCRVVAASALGLLMSVCPSEHRDIAFGALLNDALRSRWALQRQLAAVVVEEYAVAAAAELDSGPPDIAAPPEIADALALALDDDNGTAYDDLQPALRRVRDECAGLLTVLGSTADVDQSFGIDAARQVVGPQFTALAGRRPRSSDAADERRQRALAAVEHYDAVAQQYGVATRAAVAGAVVALGRLPTRLNGVMRALMGAVKLEASELLQTRAATASARLTALCYAAERGAAADKLLRNLATLACSDPWTTPVFAQRANQRDCILMLEAVQRELALKQPQNASAATPLPADAAMAAAAAASAQASNRKRRTATSQSASAAVPLVLPAAVAEDQARELAARLTVRGAERALAAVAQLFGADLMRIAPRLWACVAEPLAAVYGAPELSDGDQSLKTDVDVESEGPQAQTVIDALRVLLVLAPAVHPALHIQLTEALLWALQALSSRFAAVRHVAARAVAELSCVAPSKVMPTFVRRVLPALGDTATHRRQGAAEAVYYVVQRQGEAVLPYVTFLLVPVLGRMSDVDEQTRLVCTTCFAQLLRLVPLEADIPDPVGLDTELIARRERERAFLAQLLDPTKLEPFAIPVPINAALRKYQQEGVDWLAFLNRYGLHGVLCDDMGLGKTLQTICIVASDHHQRRKQLLDNPDAADCQPLPTLVVCPPTLISHWENEIRQYTVAPDSLRPLCYAGPPTERRPLMPHIAANEADVVIMSYDVVRNDIELLVKQNWNYCILDEGHCIRNARTKLTQAVKRLHARRRLILSGTPVQNNVLELWSLFDFLMPGFLGTERQFNELYTKPIMASRDAKQMQTQAGEHALQQLHRQVLPFLLRRMKEDVLQDLPPKIIQDYYCELSPLQRLLYEEFARSAVSDNLKRSLGIAASEQSSTNGTATNGESNTEEKRSQVNHVFQALQYLRKLCNHPALVLTPNHPLYNQIETDLHARGSDLHSLDIAPKLLALRDLLNQCGIGVQKSLSDEGAADALLDPEAVSASHRVLIFCQHKEMIERIEQDLFKRAMPGVTHMRVDGTVEARRRQEIVTQFNADPSIDCLLLTTRVGGLGLNLTGADTVIFVEHDYNPAMDLQAMDRAHRLGQTRVVNVYRLITRNTLEEKIMGLQAFKLHMAGTIVNQQNAGLSSMNTDQLLDLFDCQPTTKKSTASSATENQQEDGSGSKSISKAMEGLEELWDSSQYENEYNLDTFISTLQD
ncbi:TATA-binding protein-associated factor mot1 [Coemansia sp. RSA 988]|nr:TATA-binding protein-associated factor mot1 [Coemansia sp. RSA 988]